MREHEIVDGVRLTPPRVKEGLGRGAKAEVEMDVYDHRGKRTRTPERHYLWRADLERLREWIDEALA